MTYGNTPMGQWIRMEHYRLHTAEDWPESPQKDATLAAIHSALHRLEMEAPESTRCMVCASRKTGAVVLQFPAKPQESAIAARRAA